MSRKLPISNIGLRVYLTDNTAKLCSPTSNSTQDLKESKQKLFHQMNDNVLRCFQRGIVEIYFPDNLYLYFKLKKKKKNLFIYFNPYRKL